MFSAAHNKNHYWSKYRPVGPTSNSLWQITLEVQRKCSPKILPHGNSVSIPCPLNIAA